MTADVIAAIVGQGHVARFVARGDSMWPLIRSGDAIEVRPVDVRDLRRGDVVLAHLERGLTAHRIVTIEENNGTLWITTRGDNCAESDPPFSAIQVLGRVKDAPMADKLFAKARDLVRRALR